MIHQDLKTLKAEWDALQPLATDHERRLWQKLRLEWNYHSNHIEGNTLTYGDTQLLLFHDQTRGIHTLREYEEMKAHDVGIAQVRELAADATRQLTEADIRDLNRIILKEPFWKEAQTADGQATRREIIPGEYKSAPNSVITKTGEIFEYASPLEVPAKMHALTTWLAAVLAEKQEPISAILAKLHHDFVLIHPFDDGNGRVARLLVNYVLLRQGYPPLIVPTERKPDYLAALRLADAGDLTDLTDFLGRCLERSLQMGIRAGKGESVEEPGDTEKEIALFVREQMPHKEKVIARSAEVAEKIYESGLKNLIDTVVCKMKIFEPLFTKFEVFALSSRGQGELGIVLNLSIAGGFQDPELQIVFSMAGYRGEAPAPFNHEPRAIFEFSEFNYGFAFGGATFFKKRYSEYISQEEVAAIAESVLSRTFAEIKGMAKMEQD